MTAASDAGAPLALLVVDDEDAVRFGMQAYFGARGFAVDACASLAEAVARLTDRRYAAVLSDLRLSGTDGEEGLELLRRVRALTPDRVPFVLLTGYRTDAATAEARRHGVSALLAKPSPLAEVARVVDDLLLARAA